MTFVRRMRNVHAGGNAERTQVAVEYNGPVVRTPGENRCKVSIAVLWSSAYYMTSKNHSGSS